MQVCIPGMSSHFRRGYYAPPQYNIILGKSKIFIDKIGWRSIIRRKKKSWHKIVRHLGFIPR